MILLLITSFSTVRAQDKVVLRDSTKLNVKIVENNDENIVFTYPNEDVKNKKSKSLIAYIIYTSGRKEEFKSNITMPTINGEDDWEKVIVTTNREETKGFIMIKTISVSAGNGGVFNSAEKAREKAIQKIQKKASKIKGGIVLITSENFGGKYNNISSISGEIFK